MLKRYALPLLLSPALLLAGCGTYNGGVESANQPVVQRTDYVLDLQSTGYGLAPGEGDRLAGWLQSMKLGYGDRIAVDGDAEGGVHTQVAAEAERYGVQLSDRAPITTGQIEPGTVRVVVTRLTAGVPGCPDLSRTYQPDYLASTTSSYGCAVNSNLAAMVADPADLVRGEKGADTADPATVTKAIKNYRDAKPTGGGGASVPSAGAGS